MVYLTEFGFENYSLEFINAYKNFVPLNKVPTKVSEASYTDMLVTVIHDQKGEVSNISLIKTDELAEICILDKEACAKAAISCSKEKCSDMLKDLKAGTLTSLPEFLISLWENLKPIALEKIA